MLLKQLKSNNMTKPTLILYFIFQLNKENSFEIKLNCLNFLANLELFSFVSSIYFDFLLIYKRKRYKMTIMKNYEL